MHTSTRWWLLLLSLCACSGGTGGFVDAGSPFLDPSFGTKGSTVSPFPGCSGTAALTSLVKVASGFVAAGSGCKGWALAGYTASGALDPAFADGGVALFYSGDSDFTSVTRLAVRPDGRLLVAGRLNNGSVLRQLSATGAADSAFTAAVATDLGNYFPGGFEMALQTDGNLVVAARETIMRFKPDGTRDTTFGTGGVSTVTLFGIDTFLTAISIQESGRIALVGMNTTGSKREPFVAMLTSNGALQSSYGTNGMFQVPLPTGGESTVWAVTSQSDGSVVLAGSDYDSSSPDSHPALWRATPAGVSDTSFGTNGRFGETAPGDFSAVGVLDNGSIVAAGATKVGGGLADSWLVARFTPAGKVDATFGAEGEVVFNVDVAQLNGGAKALVTTSEGYVIAGRAFRTGSSTITFGLARVSP